jgi:chemotaxis family two-component system sensor kinase Cph1
MSKNGARDSALQTAAEVQKAFLRHAESPAGTNDRLLAELQTHRIELELQNETLRQTRIELEASRDHYVDLYEYAPVGYFTLDKLGLIEAINLTGATLLRAERNALIGRRFDFLVAPEDRDRWWQQLARTRAQGVKCALELWLELSDGTRLAAHLDCSPVGIDTGQPTVRISFSDISRLQALQGDCSRTKAIGTSWGRCMIPPSWRRYAPMTSDWHG